jgi:hypothetical protein
VLEGPNLAPITKSSKPSPFMSPVLNPDPKPSEMCLPKYEVCGPKGFSRCHSSGGEFMLADAERTVMVIINPRSNTNINIKIFTVLVVNEIFTISSPDLNYLKFCITGNSLAL